MDLEAAPRKIAHNLEIFLDWLAKAGKKDNHAARGAFGGRMARADERTREIRETPDGKTIRRRKTRFGQYFTAALNVPSP
jgi:hypothetical protein